MRAIRRINNNVAVCIDGAGNECLAMGKGIGFGAMPRELTLANVERTFYDIDERYYSAINDLPADVIEFAVRCCDYVRSRLPYELSPNLVIALADHISFALQRAEEDIALSMPLAYDVKQTYPNEYRLAEHILNEAMYEFQIDLPSDEIAAVALNLVNARISSPTNRELTLQRADDAMLLAVTKIVEQHFGITVDRTSFAFSRYATHMRYLFARLHEGEALDSSVVHGMQEMASSHPQESACVERIVAYIESMWYGVRISPDERLYLMIHISRICLPHQPPNPSE